MLINRSATPRDSQADLIINDSIGQVLGAWPVSDRGGNNYVSGSRNRYDHMKYRRSGRSGVLLPEISLGLWQILDWKSLWRSRERSFFGPLILGLLILTLQIITALRPEERRRKILERSGIRSGFLQRPAVYFHQGRL